MNDCEDWRAGLVTRGDPPKLTKDPANATTILTHHDAWRGRLAFNEMAEAVIALGRLPFDADDAPKVPHERGQRLSDDDYLRITNWLARHERLTIGQDAVAAATTIVAKKKTFHPVREYLLSLRWDEKPRLDSWLVDYFDAEPSNYTRHVGRWWLISAVARVMAPGCKVDTVLILEGKQGLRKSQSLAALCTEIDWFMDQLGDLSQKDTLQQIHGPWIVELAELEHMSRSDVARIKAFFTARVDRFRPPYGRSQQNFPRQNVFAGTVNPGVTGYLRDDTGNRRFWPVKVHAARAEDIARDRDQLWAEALHLYRAGARWYPLVTEREILGELSEEQENRYQGDEWEALIARWFVGENARNTYRMNAARVLETPPATREQADAAGFFFGADIMEGALQLKPREMGRPEQTRVGSCLSRLGLVAKRPRVDSSARPTVYAWPQGPPWAPTPPPPVIESPEVVQEVVQENTEKSGVGQPDDRTTSIDEMDFFEDDDAEVFDRSL